MMGSTLLRSGQTSAGLQVGSIGTFEGVRRHLRRDAPSTLRYRPVVLVLVDHRRRTDCTFLYVLSAGAGAERRPGCVFSLYSGVANSTIDQTRLFTQQSQRCVSIVPETASIFQLTLPMPASAGW